MANYVSALGHDGERRLPAAYVLRYRQLRSALIE